MQQKLAKLASMLEHHRLDPTSGFRFLEFLPHDALGANAVVIYLHGSGERGSDLSWVKRYGLPALLARSEVSVNCPVMCPQLEAEAEWNADRLALLIKATTTASQQLVLIGYSLGGSGVCQFVGRLGPLVNVAVAIAGQAPHSVSVAQAGLEFLAIQGEQDPWPCTAGFVESINGSGGVAHSVALVGKGHYISEEALFHPGLTLLLKKAGVEIAMRQPVPGPGAGPLAP
ncbi:MAG: hypothetical protein V4858_04740 [Pseudomonadota bacterium]